MLLLLPVDIKFYENLSNDWQVVVN